MPIYNEKNADIHLCSYFRMKKWKCSYALTASKGRLKRSTTKMVDFATLKEKVKVTGVKGIYELVKLEGEEVRLKNAFSAVVDQFMPEEDAKKFEKTVVEAVKTAQSGEEEITTVLAVNSCT